MRWKDGWYWLGAAFLVLLLSACSDSDPALTPLSSSVTPLGNTVYTDDVVTDGNWLVWEGRKQNFLFYNGTKTVDLGSLLGSEYSLGTDNDSSWTGIAFDGRYVVFMADNITDSAPPQPFALDTRAAHVKAVQIGELTDTSNVVGGEIALADGIFVWMMDAAPGQPEVFYYDFNAAAPELKQLTDNAIVEYNVVVSGKVIAWLEAGDIWYMDLADPAQTAPAQGSTSGTVSNLVAADDIFAWIDGTDVVYVLNGGDPVVASDSLDANPVDSLAVGNGIITWHQNNEIRYHDVTTAAETVAVVATGITYTPYNLGVGTGFIAWDYAGDGFVYAIGDAADSQLTFATGIYSLSIDVAGSKIFYVDDLRNTGSTYPDNENPSAYLQVYDPATDTTVKADPADYQRILQGAAADGMAVWSGHAANRTLYGMQAGNLTAPIAITPPEMNARQPQLDNGILAFKALDRTAMDGLGNGDDVEIYYCKLNVAGRPITQVTNDDQESDAPRIGGNLIFWYENATTKSSWYHNIATGVTTELTAKGTSTAGGATDGRYFVWYNGAEVHYFDTTTATDVVVNSPDGSVSKCPSLAKGLVTWLANDASGDSPTNYSIYAIDFNDPALDPLDPSASIIKIDSADTWEQKPTTDGRYIVWGGDDQGGPYAIRYYDLQATSPAVTTLTADTIDEACTPRLDNGLMIWAANAYGAASVDGDREIFAYNFNAAVPEVIQLTDNDLWDSQPSVNNGVVTWRTGGASYWNWYGKLAAALRF